MNLKCKIQDLCKKRNISMNQLEQELKFGKGYISKLGRSTPNINKIAKIADYFEVTVDYLLDNKDAKSEPKQESTLTARDKCDIAKDLDRIMEKLDAGEARPASYNGEELDPEAADLFRGELEIALKRLKLLNKEKYNPNKNKN